MVKSDKQISISGRNHEVIASQYINLMDNGFNLTMAEIASYLRCSYLYVQKNIAPYIQHIVINNIARKALFDWHGDHEIHRHLFIKRILFSRSDFNQFFLQEAKLIRAYDQYFFTDLSEKAQQYLMQKTKKNKDTARKIIKKHANELREKWPDNLPKKTVIESISQMPVELYSLKDLVEIKFRYNMDAYRFINDYGIPKIKIGSLIRYRKEDIDNGTDVALSWPLVFEIKREKMLQHLESFCYR